MSVRRIMLLTKEFGVDARSGGMLRTRALAEALAEVAPVVVVSPQGIHEATRALDGGGCSIREVYAPTDVSFPKDVASFVTYRTLGGVRTVGGHTLRAVREVIAHHPDVDVAVLDHTCLFGLRSELPPRMRVIASMHNVESDLMQQRCQAERGPRRLAARLESRLLARQERDCAHLATIVCTPDDADRLRHAAGVRELVVARNGVTPPASSRSAVRAAVAPTDEELLFTGALDWGPNESGIRWLLRSSAWSRLVHDRPGLRLTIAGRRPSPRFLTEVAAAPAARVEADVPSMQPLLDRARLGIAPLLEGGGSRIKLLEYAASGLPCVSTRVGASGLDALPVGAITTTPEDPEAFCAAIARALDTRPDVLPAPDVERVLGTYAWANALAPVRQLVGPA